VETHALQGAARAGVVAVGFGFDPVQVPREERVGQQQLHRFAEIPLALVVFRQHVADAGAAVLPGARIQRATAHQLAGGLVFDRAVQAGAGQIVGTRLGNRHARFVHRRPRCVVPVPHDVRVRVQGEQRPGVAAVEAAQRDAHAWQVVARERLTGRCHGGYGHSRPSTSIMLTM
jgi:hypothetical protein